MSRSIKFRAWNTIGNEMVSCESWTMRQLMSNDPTFIKMQFTALSDKNGKEHFCDDIFDIGQTVNGQSKFVIVDCIGGFDVRYAYNLSRKYEYSIDELLDINKECTYEITGSIHQDAQLLK